MGRPLMGEPLGGNLDAQFALLLEQVACTHKSDEDTWRRHPTLDAVECSRCHACIEACADGRLYIKESD